jgi:hypothetical protein
MSKESGPRNLTMISLCDFRTLDTIGTKIKLYQYCIQESFRRKNLVKLELALLAKKWLTLGTAVTSLTNQCGRRL